MLLLKGDLVSLGLPAGSSEKWAKISPCLMGLQDLTEAGWTAWFKSQLFHLLATGQVS